MPDYLDFCEDADPDEARRKANRMEEKWRRLIEAAGGKQYISVRSEKYLGTKGMDSYRLRFSLKGDQNSAGFKAFIKKLGW